eukprot:2726_1
MGSESLSGNKRKRSTPQRNIRTARKRVKTSVPARSRSKPELARRRTTARKCIIPAPKPVEKPKAKKAVILSAKPKLNNAKKLKPKPQKPKKAATRKSARSGKPQASYKEKDSDDSMFESSDSSGESTESADDTDSEDSSSETSTSTSSSSRPPSRGSRSALYCPFTRVVGHKPAGEKARKLAWLEGRATSKALVEHPVDIANSMYLVLWPKLAHIHCSWVTADYVEKFPQGRSRIKTFERRQEEAESNRHRWFHSGLSYFNPEYVHIDLIASHRRRAEGNGARGRMEVGAFVEWGSAVSEASVEFLVKWRCLGYDEATWESTADLEGVDNAGEHIERYRQLMKALPSSTVKTKSRWMKGKRPAMEKNAAANLPLRTGELRSYQKEGVDWLCFNWHQSRCSLLADEMGLGKTVQVAACLNYLAVSQSMRGPFIVVAPLSTLQHWRREIRRFTPLHPVVYHGSERARAVIRDNEFNVRDCAGRKIPGLYRFNVLVTTYEVVMCDTTYLNRIDWALLVLDEAHRLKNRQAKILKDLSTLRHDHCVMLTGTPIQNNVDELWSLLHFLDRKQFESMEEFGKEFGQITDLGQVDELKRLLGPYVLRRLKSDVETELKERREIIVEVELTLVQKQYYRAVYEKNLEFLTDKTKRVTSLRNISMQLRKCCLHPFLIGGVEDTEVENAKDEDEVMDILVKSSGKFVLLDKLLPRLKSQGHRVLLFSQMTRLLDIVEDYVNFREYVYERIDGNVTGSNRQESIDRFNEEDSDRFIFLLSTRAGGVGINLTSADTVIMFDSDWNPQNDIQAQSRCHRIGQTKEVKVYRLITNNSYEKVMFQRASEKLALDHAVLHSMQKPKSKSTEEEESRRELEEILKKGAFYAFNDDPEAQERTNAFCEESIDTILERSKVITVEQSQSALSKATFVPSNTSDQKIDVNDPDFWKKIGFEKKAEILPTVRTRKQARYFGFDVSDDSDWDTSGSSSSTKSSSENDADFANLASSSESESEDGSSADGSPKLKKQKRKKAKPRLDRGLQEFAFPKSLMNTPGACMSDLLLQQPFTFHDRSFMRRLEVAYMRQQFLAKHLPEMFGFLKNLPATSGNGANETSGDVSDIDFSAQCDCSNQACTRTTMCTRAPSNYTHAAVRLLSIQFLAEGIQKLESGPSEYSWRCQPASRLIEQLHRFQDLFGMPHITPRDAYGRPKRVGDLRASLVDAVLSIGMWSGGGYSAQFAIGREISPLSLQYPAGRKQSPPPRGVLNARPPPPVVEIRPPPRPASQSTVHIARPPTGPPPLENRPPTGPPPLENRPPTGPPPLESVDDETALNIAKLLQQKS